MREILFRGKREDSRERVYGYLGRHPSPVQIGDYNNPWTIHAPPADPDDNGGVYWVDPATVGQYTGPTDKNGVKIFDGGILMHSYEEGRDFGVVLFGERAGATMDIGFYVEWVGENASVYRKDLGYWARVPDCEVCGNTYDNPELLEEE